MVRKIAVMLILQENSYPEQVRIIERGLAKESSPGKWSLKQKGGLLVSFVSAAWIPRILYNFMY